MAGKRVHFSTVSGRARYISGRCRQCCYRTRSRSRVCGERLRNFWHRTACHFQSSFSLTYDTLWYTLLMSSMYVYSVYALIRITADDEDDDGIPDLSFYLYAIDCFHLVDVVCAIASQTVDRNRIYKRPTWLLVLEIISIVPFERFTSRTGTARTVSPRNYLYALHALKTLRVFHHIYFVQTLMPVHMWHLALLYVLFGVYFGTLVYAIAYEAHCKRADCSGFDRLTFYNNVVTKMTTWGFSVSIPSTCVELLIVVVAPAYIYVTRGLIMGMIFVDYFTTVRHRFGFRNVLRQCRTLMRTVGVDRHHAKQVLAFYDMLWEERCGYHYDRTVFAVVPEAMRTEITLDMYCVALRHSLMYRDRDPCTMRFLTSRMRQKFYCAGENIYVKGSYKNKMIYVVSGTVQILSEMDDATPLFSLTSGTCIGETSLLVSQLCKFTIRCKNFVELQELTRIDFAELIHAHPDEYRALRRRAVARVHESERSNALARRLNRDAYDSDKDHITALWLKHVMKEITQDKELMTEMNIYLQAEENRAEKLSKYVFTAKHLDLLVLAGRTETTDCEIVRAQFPIIFHPRSLALRFWNGMVLLCVCYVAIVLPLRMFRSGTRDHDPTLVDEILFLRVVDNIFVLDILVQLSTAVLTGDESCTTFGTIARYRFHTATFLVELLAAVRLEVFNCLLIREDGPFTIVFMRSNRLLKLRRVWQFFAHLENSNKRHFYVICHAKLILACAYAIYVYGCLFYASTCAHGPRDDVNCNIDLLYWSWFAAVQLLSGVGLMGPHDRRHNFGVMYNVLMHFSSLAMTLAFTYVTCTAMLTVPSYYWVRALIGETENDFGKYGIAGSTLKRAFDYVEINWMYNEAIDLIDEYKINKDLPSALYHNTIEQSYFNVLKNVKMFRDADDAFLHALCPKLSTRILPSNEIVCRCGDLLDHLIVVRDGTCRISKRRFNRYDALNPLTFAHRLPVTRTCVTITDCVLLTLAYDDFLVELKRFDVEHRSFVAVIDATRHYGDKLLPSLAGKHWRADGRATVRRREFYYFGYDFELDSMEEYEYHVPFDRSRLMKHARFLLMRLTLDPNGRAYFAYECVRSFVAVCAALVNSLLLFATWYDDPRVYALFAVLDAFAYVDVYVRMHVAYYDRRGILVTHPLLTAKRYARHSLIVDLLAVFPFEAFRYSDRLIVRTALRLNRLLQLHRYIGLMDYVRLRDCKRKSALLCLQYVPIVVVLLTAFGSVYASLVCDSTSGATVRCSIDHLAVDATRHVYVNVVYAQIHCVYLMSSAANEIGINEAPIRSGVLASYVAIATLLGMFYACVINSTLTVFCGIGGTNKRMYYQSAYANLKGHAKRCGLTRAFVDILLDYADLKWKRQRGKAVLIPSQIYHTIRQDAFEEIYAATIASSLFSGDGDEENVTTFFRNLFLAATHESLPRGTHILTYGNISNNVYVVHRGTVDVIDKYGQLFARLSCGALFGSLSASSSKSFSKCVVETVARTDVELIVVKTERFHEHLAHHQAIRETFQRTILLKKFFVPSRFDTRGVDELRKSDELAVDLAPKRIAIPQRLRHFFAVATCHPESVFIYYWKRVVFAAAFASIVLYLFQVGLDEVSIGMVVAQYVSDAVYIVDFCVQDHVAYMDNSGDWVYDVRKIKLNRRRKKRKYWINLLATIPFDLAVYALPIDVRDKEIYLRIFRSNRTLRAQKLIEHFDGERDDIKRNALALNMNMTYLVSFLFFHSLSCTLLLFASFYANGETMSYNENVGDLHGVPFARKLVLYVKHFYITFAMLSRVAQDIYYPLRAEFLVLFTLIMSLAPLWTTWIVLETTRLSLNLRQLKVLFRQKIEAMMYFVDREKIGEQIVSRMRRYIDMLWIEDQGIIVPDLLRNASICFAETYFGELYVRHLDEHALFGNCSSDFKRHVIARVTVDRYFNGDYVTFKGTINGSMYFVHDGEVLVCDEIDKKTETVVGSLGADRCFGEREGYKNRVAHRYSYKAKTRCLVLCLKYTNWCHLIEFFPFDRDIIELAYRRLK